MHLPSAFHPPVPLLPHSKRLTANHNRRPLPCSPTNSYPLRTATTLSADKPDANTEPDFIERAYSFFFGPKQPEPFGLKRFDRDRFPELYPATLDEFAPPHPSDSPDIALFRPLLARTQLTSRPIQLLYDANRDGWTADAFHSRCDRKGASVVLARTQRSLLGGYNPKGFVGYGESRGSKAAFLFCWPDGDVQKPAMKMRKVGGVALAVMDDPETGPKFGADSLVIPLRPPGASWEESSKDRVASSKLGSYYERRPDGGRSLFGEGENWKGESLVDLKVFAGVYEDGEEIPFSDALPFSLE